MGVSIRDLIEIKISGREPNVWLCINPDGKRVPVSDQHPLTDIELSFLYYQSILYVFLADVQLTISLVANGLVSVLESDHV